ncbi:hypothetical protein X907_1814 [Glycocaulis alkaliphilus]|uniref:Uncharacterized protein n=1 Tax=Glycocaulis alkaliphilus TaxID=1434191 RepID=A0A3T0EAL0_9PROT|nr:hypothetical protein [Glycocaulis alkaliphilus]AZU04344.1 hypothetical protein X907_1814 [Glycocaulis alkaliphilus]GGB77669.1 hypothetical protein GCM10007417_16960 [Glycocaulis alkaliphilus]
MAVNARSENAESTVSGALPDDIAIPAMSNPAAFLLDAGTHPLSPAPSPARTLQQELDAQLTGFSVQIADSAVPGGKPQWSARRTLALILVSNGVAWAALACAIFALTR